MAIFSSDVVQSAISASISDTAVDVFVYDTSKDSDGGAWRKRTQNTSWYNETLGTATRGSRKEFPAVAVIVVETSKVTIYDGDDPDLPLWITFPTTTAKGVTALNGELCLCSYASASAYHGLLRINFVADQAINHRESGSATVQGYFIYTLSSTDLAKIDDGPSSWTGYTSEVPNIVNGNCNDITMTVLPNAPIDSATGLPVPTIAVATNGGVSVIKDDGTVVDYIMNNASYNQVSFVEFLSDNRVGYTFDNNDTPRRFFVTPIRSADTTTVSNVAYPENTTGTVGYGRVTDNKSVGNYHGHLIGNDQSVVASMNRDMVAVGDGSDGLNLVDVQAAGVDIFDSKIAFITKDYNTGWQHGNIKGAFLSDTDTTNITGSEKIANYNFAADFSTQWEAQNNANTSYDAANDRVTVTSTQNYSGITLKNASLPTLTEGKRYIMTVDVHSITNPIRFGVVSGGTKDSVNSTGTHTLVFTAGASISEVFVQKPSGSNSTFVLNSVSIREAEEDRSVNNNGLEVFGTVTKDAVATGAELVGYGPFTTSNRLRQPYNSDLNFETNDFSVMFWMHNNGTDIHQSLIGRDNREFAIDILDNTNYSRAFRIYSNNSSNALQLMDSNTDPFPLNTWSQICVNYTHGNTATVYVNGVLNKTGTLNYDIDDTSHGFNIGARNTSGSYAHAATGTKLALVRISGSAPTAEQVKKMYDDEKFLFQENAKATLYGSSDAVTALGYDEVTDQLHVGTSSGRSDFQGLRRINNTTDAITTAISASNGLVAEQ